MRGPLERGGIAAGQCIPRPGEQTRDLVEEQPDDLAQELPVPVYAFQRRVAIDPGRSRLLLVAGRVRLRGGLLAGRRQRGLGSHGADGLEQLAAAERLGDVAVHPCAEAPFSGNGEGGFVSNKLSTLARTVKCGVTL